MSHPLPKNAPPPGNSWRSWAPGLLGVTIFSYVFAQNAWISEDAYITLRSVEQLMAGNGPRWNPHERVQVFTHPLWFFLLSLFRLVSRDAFVNAVAVSYLVCLASLFVLRRQLRSWTKWFALLLLLIASKTFVDYTSSGLENPLSYLLLGLFLALLLRIGEPREGDPLGGLTRLSFVFGLLLLSRHDLATLVGPAYLWGLWYHRRVGLRRLLRPVFLGLSPFLLWTAFSLFYYGFPFPNSAHAKLDTGIPAWRLAMQGVRYLQSFQKFDPLVPAVMVLALVLGVFSRRGEMRAAALGLIVNTLYVVSVGGDFMAGRFLASAYLWAAILLVEAPWRRAFALPLLASVTLFAIISPFSPLRSTPSYVYKEIERQVGDERGIFFPVASLHRWWQTDAGEVFPVYHWSRRGLKARESETRVFYEANIGMFGYWAGTEKIIVDSLAISDPLLARLPSRGFWRIGHFRRRLPEGYLEGLRRGENLLVDPDLRRYYAKLELITRGELLSLERLKTILLMNLGHYDALLESEKTRKRRRANERLPRPGSEVDLPRGGTRGGPNQRVDS